MTAVVENQVGMWMWPQHLVDAAQEVVTIAQRRARQEGKIDRGRITRRLVTLQSEGTVYQVTEIPVEHGLHVSAIDTSLRHYTFPRGTVTEENIAYLYIKNRNTQGGLLREMTAMAADLDIATVISSEVFTAAHKGLYTNSKRTHPSLRTTLGPIFHKKRVQSL